MEIGGRRSIDASVVPGSGRGGGVEGTDFFLMYSFKNIFLNLTNRK